MDNTELHYLSYDPDTIWEQMMYNYVEAGGDILYPGDEKEMLLRSVQADIVQVFAGIDNALRMATLRYAVGDYLDIIGENRGCERIPASAATATVTITTAATGITGTLPAGTSMTQDGNVYYLLDSDFTLTGVARTQTVSVTADREGVVGNSLLTGAALTLTSENAGVISIVAASDATGGAEEEDDEAYRERIREYGLSVVTTGTAQRYEAVAKAVSSQIVDAKALKVDPAQVCVYLILSEQTGAAALLQRVLAAVSADDVRPLTDYVTVAQATNIEYALYLEYICDGTETTQAAIEAAADEYCDWQNNTVGQAFNPDRLVSLLYQAGATRVKWSLTHESTFNGSTTIQYTAIDANKRCIGTVSLEMVEQ